MVEAPPDSTKERIIEAAEALIAEHGFESVSVRDVTQRARVNVAAVSYHFGSREGLIQAVQELAIRPVLALRMELLDAALKAAGKRAPSVESVMEALIRPLVQQVRSSAVSQALFVKLAGRCMTDGVNQMPQSIKDDIRQTVARFLGVLQRALPDVSPSDLAWRLHFCHGALMETLSRDDVLCEFFPDQPAPKTTEDLLAALVSFCSAGLRG